MTYATFRRIGEIEINSYGRIVIVPTHTLGFDSDLRDVAAQAMANPGVAVAVPNTARLPRPKHSKTYEVQL